MAKASMEIEIDDLVDGMREQVSQAIYAQLTQEKKDSLILYAIEHLTAKQTSGYMSGKSPIEQAFIRGVEEVANDLAKEAIAANREKIKAVVDAAVERALGDEKVMERMASAVGGAWGRGY